MSVSNLRRWPVVILVIGVWLLAAPSVPAGSASASVAETFLARNEAALWQYRARRIMRAENKRFNARAELEAMTEFSDGRFRYWILREEGSKYVRDHVLKAVLRDEEALSNRGDAARSGLTLDN